MNIYLDIDGVLLAKDLTPANHSKAFLAYVLKNYPDTTYWLTTHCKGDADAPVRHIGHLYNTETAEMMKMIKSTDWITCKTEAIDFSKPFLWFDDNLFYGEKRDLRRHHVEENWIEVNLRKDPNQLAAFLQSFPIPINTLA